METSAIDVHPSVGTEALEEAALASLAANRIDPKFLYVTPRQADLWRQVFLRHSPIHGNPEFVRIYREAFEKIGSSLPGKVAVVGLGCGTGTKELDLYRNLQGQGKEADFAAIDVSRELVTESVGKLTTAGAGHHRSLVCDLAETAFLREWLGMTENRLPRLITFFGLVPNFAPSVIARLFRSVLRRGDLLLVSAHLVPVVDETSREVASGMAEILPQYRNPETLAWLNAAFENWGLSERVHPPEMTIGEMEGVPAFLGQAGWRTSENFQQWGHSFTPSTKPLRLFYSLRYTPRLFEERLASEGFRAERLAITSCRQEAIWCIRTD